MIPLFVLIAVPLIAKRLGNWLSTQYPSRLPPSRQVLNAVIILAMATFSAARITHVIRHQAEAETLEFPARAVAFLQQHPPAGPIFNHYDWGGYLIWKLYPSTLVFIDGRADVYGQSLFHDFADTYEFKSSWQQILQRWHIQTVIVPPNSALAAGLRSSPGWIISYQDSQAMILTSIHAETAPLGCPIEQSSTCF